MSDEEKVVHINGGNRTAPEANADLVEGIEEILAAAKAGQITGIALVAGTIDGGMITGIHVTALTNMFALLGGVTHLFRRANKELLG